ncbi:MAG TPA: 1,3-beta-galactosyl-N-acetylhexosamine phosphorylase [Candidatus Borkfalkia excrementavium]|uniref:1,3-beta-galactosyl-N-acetylhexosamine phosphorylase n=1 Tax=Candidatus Borkfalkia excrementavium TaxID=2838505 RepID=A0A9D2CGK0_9FIRM|nr:1,3-beta-galactosyl-N-acetylhexosamine phosphorylase [Candidatus Borkfalkia excrementavium]
MGKGRITIPTDAGFVEETKKIMKEWGADAVRDCDGTTLPANASELADKVYNTYFVIRGDYDWAMANKDEWQHVYLLSGFCTASSDTLKIRLMDGYFEQQVKPDFASDPKKYWEVIDRTTGRLLDPAEWDFDEREGTVTVKKAELFHDYTVSFLAISLWDPVHMYNSITNGWTEKKHIMYDPFYPKTAKYIREHLADWCDKHPETSVVRFTTFLYQFSLVFNDKGKEKNVNWFGYSMAVSPRMLDAFEKEYGYKMRAEYLIEAGRYDSSFNVPTKQYLDYMAFIEKFVCDTIKDLVKITHEKKKEAMMFLGDCWIGCEPYGEYFSELGLDAIVGSVGGGVTVRMLSDVEGVRYREGRMLPYFFPDTFFEGNEKAAVDELNRNWMTARRAMLRNPLDRIGFGGYLALAAKFHSFMKRASEICEEFRVLYDNVKGKSPKNFLTVGILNAWGKKRSWMCYMVAHELWYQQIYSYQGILEALSGLPVDVRFISFEDIRKGVPADIDVIINAGDAGTSWSGGANWLDEEIVTSVRKFVWNGGGFIGVGEPTAADANGKFFQLRDVLGVDKEIGFTLSEDKYNLTAKKGHFITEDLSSLPDYGEGMKNIYAMNGTDVLDIRFDAGHMRGVNTGEVKMAVHSYGKGRAFYAAGLPYSFENARLLYRAMLYTAGKEDSLRRAFSSNVLTDCGYYADKDVYAVINNSADAQKTDVYDIKGNKIVLNLKGGELVWLDGKDFPSAE